MQAIIAVALRKESVDRNGYFGAYPPNRPGSLSARRAWIEMIIIGLSKTGKTVALRKESVDRNTCNPTCMAAGGCRSPQGERG